MKFRIENRDTESQHGELTAICLLSNIDDSKTDMCLLYDSELIQLYEVLSQYVEEQFGLSTTGCDQPTEAYELPIVHTYTVPCDVTTTDITDVSKF